MREFVFKDHESRETRIRGEELVVFSPRGLSHMGHLHGLGGALYVAERSRDRLVAWVNLPGSRLDCSVTCHLHVVVADRLDRLLEDLDGLDVMRYNCMPHWGGSCAMLMTDAEARSRIHIALCRARTDFMDQCREKVVERRDLHDLWM